MHTCNALCLVHHSLSRASVISGMHGRCCQRRSRHRAHRQQTHLSHPVARPLSNLLPFKRLLAFWHGENVFRVTDRITAFHGEMFSSQLDSRFPFSAILMRTSISLDLSHPFFSHFCTCMDAWTQTQHPDNLCSCFPFAFSSLAVCLFHSLPLIPCNFKFTSLSCISIPVSLSSDSDAFARCSFHASLHLFSRSPTMVVTTH